MNYLYVYHMRYPIQKNIHTLSDMRTTFRWRTWKIFFMLVDLKKLYYNWGNEGKMFICRLIIACKVWDEVNRRGLFKSKFPRTAPKGRQHFWKTDRNELAVLFHSTGGIWLMITRRPWQCFWTTFPSEFTPFSFPVYSWRMFFTRLKILV